MHAYNRTLTCGHLLCVYDMAHRMPASLKLVTFASFYCGYGDRPTFLRG